MRLNCKLKARATILLIVFGVVFCDISYASFEDIGMGPRSLGMGGAFTALADDAYASYYNPAGLARLLLKEIGLSYAALYPGLKYPVNRAGIGDGFFAYIHPLGENNGTVGISWVNRHAGDMYAENSYILSYSRRILKDVYIGANFKILSLNYSPSRWGFDENYNWSEGLQDPLFSSGTSAAGVGLDMGLLIEINEVLHFGLCVKDFNQPDLRLQHPDLYKNIQNIIPVTLKFGINYKIKDACIATDLSVREYDYFLNTGVEWWTKELPFAVRAGFGIGTRNYLQISAGASYLIRPGSGILTYQIDYAFLYPLNGLSGTAGCHRLGMDILY